MDRILLIDKPAGLTSHDVVDRVRRIFNTRKVGHAGTLDPFATGLLIVGVGEATKRLQEFVGLDKTYEATARLGATSTTFDPEGIIEVKLEAGSLKIGQALNSPDSSFKIPDSNAIDHAFDRFRGGYEQRAPIFSAKKIAGKKLYELARKGKATEDMRPAKQVTISELTVLDYKWPVLKFRVRCSSGTYVRSLADDIGRDLGCGAYLTELRRTAIGEFEIKNAKKLEDVVQHPE